MKDSRKPASFGRAVGAANLLLVALFLAQESRGADARPGARGDGSIAEWNRSEPLGEAVVRKTGLLPLSDQAGERGWKLDVEASDEFSGQCLNAARWSPIHRSWAGRMPARFVPENVEVNGGMLRLWMRKNGQPKGSDDAGFHTYTSAAVQAKELCLYGYYEVRAKPMASAGSSSFWFANSGGGWRTEIDVFELGGKAIGFEHRYNMNVHVFYRPGSKEKRNWGGVWKSPTPLAARFHVYGLDWSPNRITYYFDGHPVRWVENKYWHQPLFLIFDSETMIDWLGRPQEEDLPSVYNVDYLRVWRSASHQISTDA